MPHTIGVAVHLTDSGKDSSEHEALCQDALLWIGRSGTGIDALRYRSQLQLFRIQVYVLFYQESVNLFLNKPLVDAVKTILLNAKERICDLENQLI
jgi:hypothetical protein